MSVDMVVANNMHHGWSGRGQAMPIWSPLHDGFTKLHPELRVH